MSRAFCLLLVLLVLLLGVGSRCHRSREALVIVLTITHYVSLSHFLGAPIARFWTFVKRLALQKQKHYYKKDKIANFISFSIIMFSTNSYEFESMYHSIEICTRALSEITEKCPLLSNQWSFFNSVNDMIFLISLRILPEIMKCII